MKQKLVKTQNYLVVVSDSEIMMDDYYLDDTNGVRVAITEAESYWTHRKNYKKVIAHLPLNDSSILEGLPLLPPLQIIEIGKEEFVEYIQEKHNQERCVGFMDGYNKAREKYKFTERDLDYAIDWAIKKGREGNVTITDIDNYIQFISQQKMPTHFEFEYAPIIPHQYTDEDHLDVEVKTTTNPQGQTQLVGRYIYEGGEQ